MRENAQLQILAKNFWKSLIDTYSLNKKITFMLSYTSVNKHTYILISVKIIDTSITLDSVFVKYSTVELLLIEVK